MNRKGFTTGKVVLSVVILTLWFSGIILLTAFINNKRVNSPVEVKAVTEQELPKEPKMETCKYCKMQYDANSKNSGHDYVIISKPFLPNDDKFITCSNIIKHFLININNANLLGDFVINDKDGKPTIYPPLPIQQQIASESLQESVASPSSDILATFPLKVSEPKKQ
jgi:hypothetical protein